MKKIVYLSMLVLGMAFVGCSSDGDEPEPTQTADSAFIGKFNVEYYDGGGARKVGEGFMDTNINGFLTFGYIPTEYIIPKMILEGKEYTLDAGQVWSRENFGYTIKNSDMNDFPDMEITHFTLQKPLWEERFSVVTGTYNGQEAGFAAIYDESEAVYSKCIDAWEGTIKIKALFIIDIKTGKEIDKIEPKEPFILEFRNSSRVNE